MARALIVNFGPETLKIEAQGRDERGQYMEKSERTIPPGQARYVNASNTESVQVIALPTTDEVES